MSFLLRHERETSAYYIWSVNSASSSNGALKAPIRIPRKSPKKRYVFADEYVEFVNIDKIMKSESIDETLPPPGYTIVKYEDHIVFYKIEHIELSIPQVTECIESPINCT